MASSAEKKAEFRRYLESSGVMDAIVKSLVQLYQQAERPADPIEFVRNQLGCVAGDSSGGGGCEEKDKKIEELNKTIEEMTSKLSKYEPVEGAHEPAASAAPVAAPPAETTDAPADVAPEIPSEAPAEAPAEGAAPAEGEAATGAETVVPDEHTEEQPPA
ncbi:hypothetical protein M8J76_001345 [Diaphorina citri]|nr:hypothetical protein M8J75_012579 [Diaphorina citri]KAI5736240.1 hypothetical protein M8J76_001345 [Diaphorina citri]KAI5743243.1 hypothetical protein M8J77_016107 [Diaphorina citri]